MRNIVAGLFERAKGYWTGAMTAKVLAAVLAFAGVFYTHAADMTAIAILVLQVVASLSFARADYLKVAAEPILSRLDFEESLGWTMAKEYRDEQAADFKKFDTIGQRVRGGEPYFRQNDLAVGPQRLRKNILESALYSRTLAIDARNVVCAVLVLLAVAFIASVVSGVYQYLVPHTNSGDEHGAVVRFIIAALILLVEVDLAPLAVRYHVFASIAKQTRSVLSSVATTSSESVVLPAVVEYQLARTAAPLLPTFAFLKKRFPLASIWANADGD